MAPRVVDQPASSRPLPDSFASVIENLKEQREKIREQLPDMKFQIPTNFRDIGKIPSLSELAQAVPQLNPDRFKNITQVISTVMNMNSTGSQQRPPNPIELFREVAKNVTSNTSGRFNSTNISNMLENSSIMNMTRPFFNMSGNTNFTDFFPPSMNMSNMFNGTMMNLTRPFQQMFNTSSGNMSTFPIVDWIEHYNGSMPDSMMNQPWFNGTYPNLPNFTLPPVSDMGNWSRPNINMTNAETAIENAINQVNSIIPTNSDVQNLLNQAQDTYNNMKPDTNEMQNMFNQAQDTYNNMRPDTTEMQNMFDNAQQTLGDMIENGDSNVQNVLTQAENFFNSNSGSSGNLQNTVDNAMNSFQNGGFGGLAQFLLG